MVKLKLILSLLMVLMLIITTNLVDKASFERIHDASDKIYSDRLVAQDLILKFNHIIQRKELSFETSDSSYYQLKKQQDDEKYEQLSALYLETELTEEESKTFEEMSVSFKELIEIESEIIHSDRENVDEMARQKIAQIREQLWALSEIQLVEGRKQSSLSANAMTTVNLLTKIEIILIIFLALVINGLILFSKKAK